MQQGDDDLKTLLSATNQTLQLKKSYKNAGINPEIYCDISTGTSTPLIRALISLRRKRLSCSAQPFASWNSCSKAPKKVQTVAAAVIPEWIPRFGVPGPDYNRPKGRQFELTSVKGFWGCKIREDKNHAVPPFTQGLVGRKTGLSKKAPHGSHSPSTLGTSPSFFSPLGYACQRENINATTAKMVFRNNYPSTQ
ncbi:hypothetical protein TNIN_223481 [Trichonephila inaurata madagascariensis]|uniref:Uncharacterized protein n=1 Tax=Trichonephila inaurata madagascariensis TaxID=2747483 RepID=A0A8X6KDV2_9ARAC|nr:hypothetical protein TNIN_223481 [Trichonephila inaurata madagascariensis]